MTHLIKDYNSEHMYVISVHKLHKTLYFLHKSYAIDTCAYQKLYP